MRKSNLFSSFLLLTAFFIASVTMFCVNAQAQTPETKKDKTTIYKIQLGAFKDIPTEKFENLTGVFPTYMEETGKGLQRIIVGDYPTREKAEKVLEKLKEMGHTKAYIVTQKVEIPKTKPVVANNTATPATTTATNKKAEPVEKMETLSVLTPAATTTAAETIFVIQLGAYKNLDLKSFGNIVDLGDLMVENENGLTKVYISKFVSKPAAEKALSVVKQRGYTNAFIREDK